MQLWKPEWVTTVQNSVHECWNLHYKSTGFSIPATTPTDKNAPKNEFYAWMKYKQAPLAFGDEYEQYISTPCLLGIQDARKWWLEPAQRRTYPSLSIMAIDLLSIPAIAAEPEHLFSGAKLTITDTRNWLQEESINATV